MTDNPNVMRSCMNGVVTQISKRFAKHIVDIGGCSLHHISNAVKNSLSELYQCKIIEELFQDLCTFFKNHVEFCDKFSEIQDVLILENHKILQYCEIRFLSVFPVVDRLLEQQKAVKVLFLEEVPKYHKKVAENPRVVCIINALKSKFTLPTLYFIRHSLEIYQKYEKLFQRSDTTIHLLFDKQVDLFRTTLIYFCHLDRLQRLRFSEELLAFDFEKPENILPVEEFSIGINAKKLISGFEECDKLLFLQSVKRFFIKISKHIRNNLSLQNKFLANLRFLKPENKIAGGEKMILDCASSLPPISKFTPKDMDALSIEWKLYVLEDLPEIEKVNGYVPVREYWKRVFELEDAGEPKFPLIQRVVRFALSLAEGNAGVERLFSQIFHIISKERNKLSTEPVRGLLITKSYLENKGGCINMDIDNSMIASVNQAHENYVQRTNSNKKDDACLHKRILEDAQRTV